MYEFYTHNPGPLNKYKKLINLTAHIFVSKYSFLLLIYIIDIKFFLCNIINA